MFCSNCGKPLADGAKFCSNCGAKVEAPAAIMTEERPQAPASKKPSYDFGMEWAPSEAAAKPKKAAERKVSFDWSSVIDETHKKPRVEVRSPWDTTGLDEAPQTFTSSPSALEDEIFADAAASKKTEDRGRTLTFIDILKQERSEKERRAYEAARRTEDEVTGYDTPLPTNTILPEEDRIVTQGYTDLKQDIIAEMRHTPARDFDKQLESAKERRLGSTPLFTPEPPRSFVEDFFNEPKKTAPRNEEPETVEDELEAILADNEPILDEPVIEEAPVVAPEVPAYEAPEADDLFDDVEPEVEAEPEDAYDEYMDYVPRGRAARNRYVEEEYDDDDDDEEEIEETPAEEPAEAVSAVDDEIAALQAKLEMLLNMKSGAAPAAEPADEYLDEEDEEPAEAPAEEIGEYLDEDIFNAELKEEAEEEIEEDIVAVVEEEPAVEIEEPVVVAPVVEEAPAAEPAVEEEPAFDDDAISSIEALLSDLLPEEATADTPIVAEEPVTEESVIDEEPEVDLDAALAELTASIEEPVEEKPAVEEMSMDDINAELASLGLADAEPETPAEPEYKEEDMLFTSETTDTSSDTVAISTDELAAQEAMSIEELEKDLFGPAAEDPESEATKKIEKFYTLYRKNDEFQKLLDAEYDKLQGSKYEGPAPEKALLADEPDIEALTSLIDEPAPAKKVEVPAVAEVKEAPAPAPEKKADKKVDKKAEKAAAKAAKKAEKKAKAAEEDDDEEVKGGGFLTVLAIIVALLLVVLLVIILVLNFMPESSIAQTLNDVIGNLTSFIASNNTELLL